MQPISLPLPAGLDDSSYQAAAVGATLPRLSWGSGSSITISGSPRPDAVHNGYSWWDHGVS